MPQSSRMSDAQLRHLYFSIANHYKDCKERKPKPTPLDMYNELYNGVYASVEQVYMGSFSSLSREEKNKAYTILNTFFYACPEGRAHTINFAYGLPPQISITVNQTCRQYYHHDNFFINWMLLRSLDRPSPSSYNPDDKRHDHPSKKKDNKGEAVALIVLIALALAACAASFIALYYLLSEAVNSVERFSYNEGWLQASLSLLGMAAGGVASALLSNAFLMGPLMSLAFAAGVANPAGIAVLGIVCLTAIGAAAGGFITNQIQHYMIKEANADALDPVDPHRFGLTDAECQFLNANGIDPVKVKCAIVALRGQMNDKPVPPMLSMPFMDNRGKAIQDALNKVRQLRRGELVEVEVGILKFNCALTGPGLQTAPLPTAPSYPYPQQYDQPVYTSYPEPSAPYGY